jgi:hypothetical protein
MESGLHEFTRGYLDLAREEVKLLPVKSTLWKYDVDI